MQYLPTLEHQGQRVREKELGELKATLRLGDLNDAPLRLLLDRLRTLTPFVGAGLSIQAGLPGWADLLRSIVLTDVRPALEAALEAADFEQAAEIVADALGAQTFNTRLEAAFACDPDPAVLARSAVRHIPRIADEVALTTNFDRVLEAAFKMAGHPFGPHDVYCGTQIHALSNAIQARQRILYKLHGDFQQPGTRVLTLTEYVHAYGGSDPDALDEKLPLPQALRQITSNRSLLFLGCSLAGDRTTRVLARVGRDLPGTKHFALLAEAEHTAPRLRRLAEWNINPIFFPTGAYNCIDDFLAALAQIADMHRRRIALARLGPERTAHPANAKRGEPFAFKKFVASTLHAVVKRELATLDMISERAALVELNRIYNTFKTMNLPADAEEFSEAIRNRFGNDRLGLDRIDSSALARVERVRIRLAVPMVGAAAILYATKRRYFAASPDALALDVRNPSSGRILRSVRDQAETALAPDMVVMAEGTALSVFRFRAEQFVPIRLMPPASERFVVSTRTSASAIGAKRKVIFTDYAEELASAQSTSKIFYQTVRDKVAHSIGDATESMDPDDLVADLIRGDDHDPDKIYIVWSPHWDFLHRLGVAIPTALPSSLYGAILMVRRRFFEQHPTFVSTFQTMLTNAFWGLRMSAPLLKQTIKAMLDDRDFYTTLSRSCRFDLLLELGAPPRASSEDVAR